MKIAVVDHGLFVFIAQRLAENNEVSYFSEWETGSPVPDKAFIAYGLPGIDRIDSFFEYLAQDKPDLIVFTDVGHGDWQEDLRGRGFKVFGTGRGEIIEDDRVFFRKILTKLKLPVSPYKVINGGVDELREKLKSEKNKFVKLSLFRGIKETFHWEDYESSRAELDELGMKLGLLDREIEFLIEDPVDSEVEVGAEWMFTDVGFLPKGMYGYEEKNKGYFGKISTYDALPKLMKTVMDKFAPVYKKYKIKGELSTEIRVTKDGKPFFIDPCQRFPSPPGESLSEAYENLGEMMLAVAEGKTIEPKERAKYFAQVMLQLREPIESQLILNVKESQLKNLKIRNLCKIRGKYIHLPEKDETVIGAAIGYGNKPEEAKAMAMEAADKIATGMIYYDHDVFEKIDDHIKKGRRVGVEF